jgi:hypothetical protein
MTGHQTVVMWSGITLIILRFFTTNQFRTLWAEVITGGDPSQDWVIGRVPDKDLPWNKKPSGGSSGGHVMGGPLNTHGNPGSGYNV